MLLISALLKSLSEEIAVLLRSEGVYLAAPVCKLAGSDLLIDCERNVVDHLAWLARNAVAVLHEVLCTESLDRE